MRKISRYIARTVISAIALTLLVFMSLDFIFGLINQLETVRGNFTISEAFIYMLLTTPRRIYTFIPYSCLIGCLAGLGVLASSSELVVVRSAGVSTGRIVWMSLRPALVFIFVALIIGEYIAPYSEQLAVNRRAIALGESVKATQQKTWNHETNEFMHFDAVLPSGVIYGVSRYLFNDEQELVSASYTRQAVYQGKYWQEEDIAITHIDGEGSHIEKINARRWDTEMTPELLNMVVQDPKELSIRNLHYYMNYLSDQKIENNDYSLAFWQKVLEPVATASLVLIAISFIFGPLRSVTMGQRIFTGVIFGVVFRLVQSLLGPSSLVFGFPPVLAVLFPIAFCFGLGFYLLNRAR